MDTYTWIDPDGVETVLPTGDPKKGTGMPPVRLTDEPTISGEGSRFRHVRKEARVVDLLCVFRDNDDADVVRSQLRDLGLLLDPTRGDGILRRTRGDGTARELVCRYSGGLELDEVDPHWQPAVLSFRAFDPHWRSIADTVLAFTTGAGLPTFFPFPPLTLAAGGIWAQPEIDNPGDVEAWPVWTIEGPTSGLALTNTLTGEMLDLAVVLAEGETVTIDTRPGRKTIRDGAGVNRWPDLQPGSKLWPLARGIQTVELALEGASDASSVGLAFRIRWNVA